MSDSINIWIDSDLQPSRPSQAEETLNGAVEDLIGLRPSLDEIWCLGDAICGKNLTDLEKIAEINQRHLARLGVPVYHVMGNQEMDLKSLGQRRISNHLF